MAFEVLVTTGQGISYPYYVMGKTRLPISPFTDPWVWVKPCADPFDLFARAHGTRPGLVDPATTGIEAAWYDWLSATLATSPASASGSLHCCAAPLRHAAEALLEEYQARWPAMDRELSKRIRDRVPEAQLRRSLQANEKLFGLRYPSAGSERFYVTFFPTQAAQRPGPHFVLGAGCLDDRHLLRNIEDELGLTLLAQLLEHAEVRAVLPLAEELARHDRDVRGRFALLEAVNQAVRALAAPEAGAHGPLHKPQAQGYERLLDSLLQHGSLLSGGLAGFVAASVRAAGHGR